MCFLRSWFYCLLLSTVSFIWAFISSISDAFLSGGAGVAFNVRVFEDISFKNCVMGTFASFSASKIDDFLSLNTDPF